MAPCRRQHSQVRQLKGKLQATTAGHNSMEPERPQVGRPHLPLGRGANTLSSSCGLSAGGRCCCICSDCWGGGGGGGPAAAAWETKVACSAACAVGVLTAALERIDSLWCAHPLFHPLLSRSLRCRRARFELRSCQVDPNVKQGSDAPMPPIHVLPCMGETGWRQRQHVCMAHGHSPGHWMPVSVL